MHSQPYLAHIDPIDHTHRYKEVHKKTEDRLREVEVVAP